MNLPTFDESWHLVSPRRIRFRPGVEIFPQRYRGQRWYVIKDGLSGKFFRVRPEAYLFLCELERNSTVDEAWQSRLGIDPENSPGQGEVIKLLSHLHRAGLISSDVEGDAQPVAEALGRERHQQQVQQWTNILFFRIPLWNPDSFLRRTLPLVRWLYGPIGLVLWLGMLLWGGRELLVNWSLFEQEGEGFLSLANLPWMYATMVVIKAVHEFSHGYMCRRLGGEVPEMGIMLLLFNPLPYVDASSSTAFRSKWHRILVAGAGMQAELLIAGVSAVVWANTGPGVVHVVAYNAILVASVITLLFNANPLLRYDGYHMLSDWLETPNLQNQSRLTALHQVKRWLFGVTTSVSPASSKNEAFWLTVYYYAALIYRTLMVVGILWFISQEYLIFGAIMAVVFTIAWIFVPMGKSLSYLWTGQDLANNRTRAVAVSGLLVAAVVAFLALVPFPQNFRANAVVRADPYARVFTTTEGWLHEVLVPSGTMVKAGQELLVMRNEELGAKLRLVEAERAEATAQARVAFEENPALYQSMKTYFRALDASRDKVLAEQHDLTLRAPCDGRWLAPDLTLRQGEAIPRGLELGVVQGEGEFFISAVVKQEDVSRLFTPEQVKQTEVKLRGMADTTLDVSDFSAIPAERESLPSAALGILGGGVTSVEGSRPNNRQLPGTGLVESQEGKGTRPTEPVFEIRATLKPEEGVRLLHGQLAVARMSLPAEPLLSQWTRQVRQLFQKGYKL